MSSELFLPPPTKLILFLLASDTEWQQQAKEQLTRAFGPIERETETILYKATQYYTDEMGGAQLRQILSFKEWVAPEGLADFKLKTNQIEQNCSENQKRKVNLDCGLLSLDKIVIASTKPASYRIYLRDGIYAQATYWYEKSSFHAWPWTYEEYQSSDIIRFFNLVRGQYQKQLKQFEATNG